jgi:alkylhydroperoxidase family enzyme
MSFVDVDGEQLPIRVGLATQIDRAWERLRRPGTWWSGSERLAIAAEVRQAENCRLCRQRKAALSPYTVNGDHDHQGMLSDAAVEAIHRLTTDAGRITGKWLRALIDGDTDLTETRYVELVAIVAIVTALDTFDNALGRSPRPLPAALDGQPARQRPAGAKRNLAWIATVAPEDITSADPNPYPIHGAKNIHRGLSLVPQEVFNFFDLDVELYLKDHEIRDFAHEYRAISHAQIELVAGRVSAINGCYY